MHDATHCVRHHVVLPPETSTRATAITMIATREALFIDWSLLDVVRSGQAMIGDQFVLTPILTLQSRSDQQLIIIKCGKCLLASLVNSSVLDQPPPIIPQNFSQRFCTNHRNGPRRDCRDGIPSGDGKLSPMLLGHGGHYWDYYLGALFFRSSHCNSFEDHKPIDFTGIQLYSLNPLLLPLFATRFTVSAGGIWVSVIEACLI